MRSIQLFTLVWGLVFFAISCHGDDSGTSSLHGDWPFSAPTQPTPPWTRNTDFAANAIDSFTVHRMDQSGLAPSRRADKLTLLRRLTFDLIGLPPTVDQQQEFLSDDSPDAYAKVVDRLMASPRYGERWAQHWLDVVRYAETEGFKADRLRESAFKYRDYVIRSLNADRPYDQFVRHQLAGDELAPNDPQALIATGLNRLYPDENNAANLFQRREEILTDITETTGLAFLGLTMGCAQCHDHKFDDISQIDYFRMRAFFAGLVERDDIPAVTKMDRQQLAKQQAIWEKATSAIRKEIGDLFADARAKSDAYHLQKFRKEIRECVLMLEADRDPLQKQIARMAKRQLDWRFDAEKASKELSKEQRKKYSDLKKQLAKYDHLKLDPSTAAMTVSDIGPEAPRTYRFANGNWQTPLEEIQPGFPEFLGESDCSVPAGVDRTRTTGRRSALAIWLTRSDHPLTARVIVNRLWHHHFGQGIVASANDFGSMGSTPTHRELIDWLAVELMKNDWSLKYIQRLIVTSATYCQTSTVDSGTQQAKAAKKIDGDNRLLWKARRRRLEGEAIRDAILRLTGQLNLQMYGPSSRPPLPEGVSKRYAWKPDEDLGQRFRRSIYVFMKRNMRFPLFDAFDQPDLHQSCGGRSSTVTAPQALIMLNSDLTQDAARRWSHRLLSSFGDDLPVLIKNAYQQAFSRSPTVQEICLASEFVRAQLQLEHGNRSSNSDREKLQNAITDFCQALLNANEFIYLD